MTRGSHAERGFTLLEMLIAMAIVAIMMFITWSVTAQVGQDKKFVAKVTERNHELRVAMSRITRDLSMAYVSDNENTGALERRTFFVGKGASDALLRFTSLAHTPLWSDANESEQTYISYFTGPDPDNRTQTNLYRRESRRLSDEGWDQVPSQVDLLVRDVEEVEFEYWEWQDEDWQSEWDSTSDSERGKLPPRVKIAITVEGRDGKPREHITQGRIHLTERLLFIPN